MRLPESASIFTALLCITAFGCTPSEVNDSVSEVQPNATLQPGKVDIGAASFAIPNGWQSDGHKNEPTLLPIHSDGSESELMIGIFVNDDSSIDAMSQAKMIAERTSVKETLVSGGVDGEVAYRVSSPPNNDVAEEWIIVKHSGKMYSISGESTERFDCWPVLDEIRQTWIWK